ncbi:MAG: TIGR00730 family Rossman fold protein [Bdellovibrionales bacterium]|nr:TIGR00730 family Rossman fold protein [Bdellovibrionales bacterium]
MAKSKKKYFPKITDEQLESLYQRDCKLEKAYKSDDFMNSVDARPLRILAEYIEPKKRLEEKKVRNTIVFFGSARFTSKITAEKMLKVAKDNVKRKVPLAQEALENSQKILRSSKYYEDAVSLSKKLTTWSDQTFGKTSKRFLVCSGGGPGIMEAANRGAYEAGGQSVGFNISLPFEANSNPFITPELNFEFHYFFTRKYWFAYLAKALVIFPGGFGTLDELAEILTLIQTRKMTKAIPVVIYGSDFWNSIIDFEKLAAWGTISKSDLDLFHFSDTPQDAFSYLKKRLSKIHKL